MGLLKSLGKLAGTVIGGPVGGALVGGAASLIGGHSAKKAQEQANAQNVALNRENRDWETDMSNTSYQRGTQDMLAAGLNPSLAYSQGGASTPGNSAATVDPEDAGAKAITSAGTAAMQGLARQQVQANIDLTKAQTDKARAEATVSAASVDSDINQRAMGNDLLHAQVEKAWADRDLSQTQKSQLQEMLPFIQDLNYSQTKANEATANSANAQARSADANTELTKVRRIAETLGLSESEAESAYWETVKAGGKAAPRATAFVSAIIELLHGANKFKK